jgi:hypothetical protein
MVGLSAVSEQGVGHDQIQGWISHRQLGEGFDQPPAVQALIELAPDELEFTGTRLLSLSKIDSVSSKGLVMVVDAVTS